MSSQLFALSDLHVDYDQNWKALDTLEPRAQDYLLIAGDISHKVDRFEACLKKLTQKFNTLYWSPGNHDLWEDPQANISGEAKYQKLVKICQNLSVKTPEDAFDTLMLNGKKTSIATTFTAYDYSFCPPGFNPEEAIKWAYETHTRCADELRLKTAPYKSMIEWCDARISYTKTRLETIKNDILYLNHYPIKQDLARLPLIPRFYIWCGTKKTESFLNDYPIKYVVYGHLHIPRYHEESDTHFYESSFGYPSQQAWYGSDINKRLVLIGDIK